MTEPGSVRVGPADDPRPGPGEVTVEVALTGICGTDLHILDGEFATARFPVTPGHEVTGSVVEAGPGVTGPRPGDRVVVDPGVPCRACAWCREGRLNLCANRLAIGVSLPGGAAELVAVPAINCHVVDPAVDDRTAVLTEPLACVLHAFDLAPSPAAAEVLVYGAGTVGLLTAQMARRLGADRVTVVDPNESRLPGARKAGADEALPDARESAVDAWPLVLDASGAGPAIGDGLRRLRRGGTFVQIGVAAPTTEVPLSPYEVFAGELTIRGSMTTRDTFARAVRTLVAGAVDTSMIVGTAVPLSRYAEALDLARSGESLKVVVEPGR
ncbi:alcohol dehydrogenase catalytic domain-containing protein [Jiangella asiatica]|nr:alcohol dehydrogenase catalytic domain-containing protein [Jiangella asiatica]